ncbi:MAG: hypothetical protein KDE15_00765 [Erythrobacter sp.]|nr:hypothetical protein [Erythrobacter sp.]
MIPSLGALLDQPAQYFHWTHWIGAQLGAIHAVQETRLLDHLGQEPCSAQDIAASAGLQEDGTRRLLEFLAAEGVLAVDEGGLFAPTDRSRLLQRIGGVNWLAGACAMSALHTGAMLADGEGRNAWTLARGQPLFEGLAENPDWVRQFAEAMGFHTEAEQPRIFAAHRFEPFDLAVDVGGSHGDLMMRLLADHPKARGIVFDRPEAAEQAHEAIAAAGMADRMEAVGGDFFAEVPAGGDLYMMKHIIHDWSDAESIAIFKTIRAAMKPRSRLAVFERIVPADYRPDIAYAFDIIMLHNTTGRERRVADFERLFADSGLRLDRVTDVPGGVSVIEAVPV